MNRIKKTIKQQTVLFFNEIDNSEFIKIANKTENGKAELKK